MLRKGEIRTLLLAGLLALLAPMIANERPLFLKYKSAVFFPAFTSRDVLTSDDVTINMQVTDFKMKEDAFAIYPLVTWSAGRSDLLNSYSSPFSEQYIKTSEGNETVIPFRFRHWLGTDGRGADVLAGLIYGFRYSMYIAFIAVLLASVIGVSLGSIAGYFGNRGWTLSLPAAIALILSSCYFLFYISGPGNLLQSLLLSLLLFSILYGFVYILMKKRQGRKVHIPIDSIVLRLVELMTSMPRLILIITLAAVSQASLLNLALILGFSIWPEVARFTRAQVLQIREEDYILAAHSLGYRDARILMNHILRNGSGPVLVLLCFAFSSIIMTEAGLAFIGVGMPADTTTWGSLLSSGRDNFDAWWLIVFPGLCIFCTVYYLNRLADRYQLDYKTSEKEII